MQQAAAIGLALFPIACGVGAQALVPRAPAAPTAHVSGTGSSDSGLSTSARYHQCVEHLRMPCGGSGSWVLPRSCRAVVERALTDAQQAHRLLQACAHDDKDVADYIAMLSTHLESGSAHGIDSEAKGAIDELGTRKRWLTAMIARDVAWLHLWQGDPAAAIPGFERACASLDREPMTFTDRYNPCTLLPRSSNAGSETIRIGYGGVIRWCQSERTLRCGSPPYQDVEDEEMGTFAIVEAVVDKVRHQ